MGRGRSSRALVRAAVICALVAPLVSCGTGSSDRAEVDPKLGVKPSPRVATGEIPKGGGRAHIGKPYKVAGRWYKPQHDPTYDQVGVASWYGSAFHGRMTANGEVFDMRDLSAAHPTLPLPSYVRVTNLTNDHSIVVRVNDRGPFAHNRLIDLSAQAAQALRFRQKGTAKVRVQYLGPARLDGRDRQQLIASYRAPGISGRQDAFFEAGPAETEGPSIETLIAANSLSVAKETSAGYLAPQVRALERSDAAIGMRVPANVPGLMRYDRALSVSYVPSYAPQDRISQAFEAIKALER